jgi:hypothetical protein
MVLTLTIARAVFQIYGTESDEHALVHDASMDFDGGYVSSIWPPTGDIDWPPENGRLTRSCIASPPGLSLV